MKQSQRLNVPTLTWYEWIKKDECFKTLLLCVKSMMRKYKPLISEVLETGNNSTQLSNKLSKTDATSSEFLEIVQLGDEYELVNDFWMFLQEGANSINYQSHINNKGILSFKNHITSEFIIHLKEIRRQCAVPKETLDATEQAAAKKKPGSYRSYRRNPRCHYYRSACEAFRHKAKCKSAFQYGHNRSLRAFYAFTNEALSDDNSIQFDAFNYSSWSYPNKYLASKKIFNAAAILETAELFWNEALEPCHIGKLFLAPVWELTSYVFSHVRVNADFVSSTPLNEDDGNYDPLLSEIGTPPDQFSSVLKNQLSLCAAKAVVEWPQEVRKALLSKHLKGRTLSDLQNEGIDSPQYRVKQASDAVKKAWIDCYGEHEEHITQGNEADELFMHFVDCLFVVCEKLDSIEAAASEVANSWPKDVRKAYYFIHSTGAIGSLTGASPLEPPVYPALNNAMLSWTLWHGELIDSGMLDPNDNDFFKFYCKTLATFCKHK